MDLRYAIRMLARTPGFTLMAVATLALAIGINIVVFSVYAAVAFHKLGVMDPGSVERLQRSAGTNPTGEFSWTEFGRLAGSAKSYEAVIATSGAETLLAEVRSGESVAREIVHARFVSGNYFSALGVKPAMGRALAGDDRGAVVVSYDFWQRRAGGNQASVGGVIRIQGTALTIVGVAPKSFEGTGQPAEIPDMWVPASIQATLLPGTDWLHDDKALEWQVLARRRGGVNRQSAAAELAVLGGSWPAEEGRPVHLSSLPATFFQTDSGEFRGFTLVCVALLAAVGLILLMGCMNLINLIVARNATRDREIAVRMALGASRLRLLRQLCSESLLLGCLGGVAGLFMSVYACRWLGVKAAAAMDELSRGGMRLGLDLSPDWHTFAWTAAISVLAGTMVGLIPAMSVGKRNLSAALKRSSGFRDPGISRKRNVLVTLQVASCLMLLAGSGLLFRGAARSSGIDPGFDVHHAMLISLDLHTLDRTNAGRAGILDRAIGQMRRVPGVRYVAWADRAPFLGHGTGVFANEAGARLSSVFDGVSEDYFDTLGIPLLAGRRFTRAEVESGAPVATISESTARHLWPGVNAVGQRITALNAERMDAGSAHRTVVGVVKTVRGTHLSKADEGAVYFPRRMPDTYGLLLLRTEGPPENSFRALSAALAGVNASLPTMCNMMTIDETPLKMERWMAEAPAMAAGILGSLAILLACLGLFGVISRLVAMRTREFGIRIALGAKGRQVAALVARQTLRPVLWGVGLGLGGAFCVSGLLQAMIVLPDVPDLTYGAGAFDPLTLLGTLAAIAVTVAIAAFAPVRRAVAVQPSVALRDD